LSITVLLALGPGRYTAVCRWRHGAVS